MKNTIRSALDVPVTVLYLPESDKRYILERYCFYLQEARKRIFPPFADIDNAMQNYSYEWSQRAGERFNPDMDDEGDLAYQAWEKSITYGLLLDEMANNVRLAVIAGLHHRWEKDVREWMVKELRHTVSSPALFETIWKRHITELLPLLDALGVSLMKQPWWPQLQAYNRIVNVFKHGSGHSLTALKRDSPEYLGAWNHPVKRNMDYVSHDDLHITEAQFDDLAATVTAFWDAFPVRVTEDMAKAPIPDWFTRLRSAQA